MVLIDSPDFTHRIARAIKQRDPSIRTVNYVAPQVWASRAYRAKAMARYFDLVLALFPFEVPFFEKYGLKAVFVGHPVIERRGRMTGGDGVARAAGHRAGCAAAGAAARQPHQRNPLHPAGVPRRGGDCWRRKFPAWSRVLPTVPHVAARVRDGDAKIGRRRCISWKARPTNSPPSMPPMWRWRPPAR